MAVFNIHPRFAATLNCDIAGEAEVEDLTTGYIVDPNSIDMKEHERQASVDGQGALVEIEFRVYVVEATQTAALGRARALKWSLGNMYGGHIEYRPIGLGSSVLTTWYHYSPAAPPQVVEGGVGLTDKMMQQTGLKNVPQKFVIKLDFKVPVKPWATSDPEAPATIVASTTIQSADDGTRDNGIGVTYSLIKGDVLFPIIKCEFNGGSMAGCFVQMRPYVTGSSTTQEVFEAESMTLTNFSNPGADAAASNGNFVRSSGAGPSLRSELPSIWDSQCLGTYVPLVVTRQSDAGDVWGMKAFVYSQNGELIQETESVLVPPYTSWTLAYTLQELRLPPVPIPSYITDDTTPDIGDFLDQWYYVIGFTRTSGSGTIDVDFVHMAKTDHFAALFDGYTTMSDATYYWTLNTWDQLNYLQLTAGDAMRESWAKYGSPLGRLAIQAAIALDHRFRFIPVYSTKTFIAATTIDVTILGIHGTIYPFEDV